MALGNGSASSTNGIFLKLVAEKGPTKEFPKFAVKVKGDDDKFKVTDETYTKIDGVVKSIKTTNNGKKGYDEVKGFVAVLEDGDTKYIIDSTMTNASKDLANHILGSIGKKVFISLYLNAKDYPTASVKLEDGSFAPTALEYKGLDKDALYVAILAQEPAKESDNPF